MVKILLADNSGFCFGVKKAIDESLNVIKESVDEIYSLGPLIHNNQVINLLDEMGLKVIEDLDEIDSGKVLIRSHGVPIEVYNQAKNNDIDIIDCTCPFVRKIQKKVNEYSERGYEIFIIGDPSHPEVIGINGWCNNNAFIVNSEEDVEDIPKYDKICIVAQTTITKDKFDILSELISSKGNTVEIFNTICNATQSRQQSCRELAKKANAMIVIGGYHSSNTQKLVNISKEYCENTYHIETVEELRLEELGKYKTIGITAGASTPEWIIKEVINKMNSLDNNMNEMMEAIENSMVRLHEGDIVKGTVISVNNDEVMVNVGYKSDGIIKRDELSNDPYIKPTEILKVGDGLEVYVVSLNDGDGNLLLSKKRVDSVKGWDELENIYKEGLKIEAKVTEVVKGGAIAVVNGVRAFIPASHISAKFVEDLNAYLNKIIDVKVIELDKDKKKVVLSRKLIEKEELEDIKNKLWSNIEKGQIIKGQVKRITNFGAFVDIGGVDGLIHISELSWNRIKHPSEVVNEGDEVEVAILDLDKGKGKVSLGLKQTIPHPWENINEKYNIGDVVEGTVAKFTDYGAFISLEKGIDGLVHISQISNEHITKPSEKLKIDEKVNVKIIDIKKDDQRISLSIKELDDKKDAQEDFSKYNVDEDITIGDMIKEK